MKGRDTVSGRIRGFTLIELVVALAVIAIGMTAVLHAASQAAHAGSFLKQRTVAHWVASNQAAEFSINREWPDPGVITGTETMADQTWRWEAEGEPTLLSFDQVETLFHEFGHGLHGLMTQVRYPSFAGTAGTA